MDAATPPLAAAGAEEARRPRLVDVATVLVLAAAVVNIGIGVLVARGAQAPSVHIAPGVVAVVVGISVLFGVVVAVAAVLFRSGRTWGRPVVLVATALSLLTLFAPNAPNLVVIVLLAAASVLLYRRSTSAWVRRLRERPRVR